MISGLFGGIGGNTGMQSQPQGGGLLGGLGQTNTQGGGMFGNTGGNTGGGLFGGSTTGNTGGGLFGGGNNTGGNSLLGGAGGGLGGNSLLGGAGGGLGGLSGGLGGGMGANQNMGTLQTKFQPSKNKDGNTVHSINAQRELSGRSLEELRYEDYKLIKNFNTLPDQYKQAIQSKMQGKFVS